jgi:predicted amidohydrolase YtcJ
MESFFPDVTERIPYEGPDSDNPLAFRDTAGRVVSTVKVRRGRIAEVGDDLDPEGLPVLDVGGRTVVPGIIDDHNHIVLMGLRPGYHTPLENAYSVADVQETIAARRPDVPDGEFITTIGGFHSNHFAERRLPTLGELDEAVADRPVLLMIGFSGPSTTNTQGRDFFLANGVLVGADGSIGSGAPSQTALFALRRRQTPEDEQRSTLDAMAYAASLGVTTHFDQGGFPATHTPADGAAHFAQYRAYDAFRVLHQQQRLTVRLRINFLHMDADPTLPTLTARLLNVFPEFGDEMMRIVGIGEFTAGLFLTGTAPPWMEGTRKVAEAGWMNQNHSLTQSDYQAIIEGWETVNAEFPITALRWTLAHVPFITEEYVERLAALGGGLSLTGWRYLAGTASGNGPPFRMIVDSGIPAGMSSDGMQIAPMNPWLHAYYATTGVNALGDLINDGQQISRDEVLRLYTADNGWFTREESVMGSLEPGKLADLVVLNKDYFSVTDEELKQVRSVLTMVGGAIVHDTLAG